MPFSSNSNLNPSSEAKIVQRKSLDNVIETRTTSYADKDDGDGERERERKRENCEKNGELPFIRRGLQEIQSKHIVCAVIHVLSFILFLSCVLTFFSLFLYDCIVVLYSKLILQNLLECFLFILVFSFSLSNTHTLASVPFSLFLRFFYQPPITTNSVQFSKLFFHFRNEMIGKCDNKKFMHGIFIHKLMLIFA